MEKRGLCSTCINEKGCIFPKQPTVWQCEEFSDYVKQKKAVCCKGEEASE